MAAHSLRLLAIAAIIYVAYAAASRALKPKKRYPPGPKGLPIVGSLFDINNERPWITFSEMCRQHGDIVMFWVMGRPTILLGHMEHAEALLQKRMMNYGDRPELVMAQDIVTQDGWYAGTARSHHNTHKKQRKIMNERLRVKALPEWAHPTATPELHLLLQRLINQPENFVKIFKTFTVNVMLGSTFGHESVPDVNHPLVGKINEASDHQFTCQIQGYFWVDYFPFLKNLPTWLPGMGWKRLGLKWREEFDSLYGDLWETTAKQNENGEGPPCLVKTLIEKEMHQLSLPEGATLAAALMDAGTETLTATTVVMMIVFMYFPHILKKAQETVDQEIGRDRLPTFEDVGKMPYILAMVREAFRWRTVAPVAIPHAVVEDDIYAGYDIPKGATVYALSQYIHEDPELYPEPKEYRPERFLDESGNLNNLPHAGFGFGSRRCLGNHFAEQTLYVLLSSFVQNFDITAPIDEKGNKILPSLDPMDWGAFLASPPPFDFKANITPRSQHSVEVINKTVESESAGRI